MGLDGIPIRRRSVYAIVSWWQLPESRAEGSAGAFESPLVPLIRSATGFLESYWTYEPANGKSVGFTLIDTAEHALDLKDEIEGYADTIAATSAHLEMVRVQEIVVHVRAGP